MTHVGGQLTDDKGAPLRDGTVLAFPTDADRWFESSRSVRATRPDQHGQWQIKGLPAGEYLAIALDYVEDGAWNDPEYLESLRRYAQKLNVTPDVAQTVTLKIVAPKE